MKVTCPNSSPHLPNNTLFFILLKTFSEMKDKYKQVETIVSWIISLTGFIILGFTIKVAVTNYKEMNSIDLIISFILPILLSTLYLPITYLFALYAKYSHLFKLLKYRKSLKKQDKENYRIKLVANCKMKSSTKAK